MSQIRVFENEYMKFEDHVSILYIWYKEVHYTLDLAKSMVYERKAFTNNEPRKVLVMQEGLKGLDKNARSYFSSDEAIEGVSAAAIVSKNAFERHLANFFIGITVVKPKVPTKLFSNQKDAVEWLDNV